MLNTFRIDVGSDQEHEDLVAEVYCGANAQTDFVAILSQEFGFESLDIEIYPRADGQPWRFKYSEFVAAIEHARSRLWHLRRTGPAENDEA